jgi:putative oxidoreductase
MRAAMSAISASGGAMKPRCHGSLAHLRDCDKMVRIRQKPATTGCYASVCNRFRILSKRRSDGGIGMTMNFLRPWAPQILSILRILAAASFFTHGTMKLFSWPDAFQYPMNALLYSAALLEIVGGALLAIGLFSRPTAFVLSGSMAVAYFIGHASRGFYPVLNGGEPAMFFCFVFLYIAAAGPGRWSVDAAMGRG